MPASRAGEATPRPPAVGVFHGRHDPAGRLPDQRVGAGRRAAVVGAGFEGDVGGGARASSPAIAQGMDFGVGSPARMPALRRHIRRRGRSRTDARDWAWW